MSDQTPPQSYFNNDEDSAIEDDCFSIDGEYPAFDDKYFGIGDEYPAIENAYSAMPYSVDTTYHFDSGLSDFGQTYSNDPGLILDTFERDSFGRESNIDPRNLVQDAYTSSTDGADRNATLNFNRQSGQPFERQSEDGFAYPYLGIIDITHDDMLKLAKTNEFWHTEISEGKRQCNICYTIFTTKESLRRHVRTTKKCKKAWNRKTPAERRQIVFRSPSR